MPPSLLYLPYIITLLGILVAVREIPDSISVRNHTTIEGGVTIAKDRDTERVILSLNTKGNQNNREG